MPVRVRFRLNKLSGEVEEFLVDDQDHMLSEAEHDRIAAEIGRVLARRPLLHEVLPAAAPDAALQREESPERREQEAPTRVQTRREQQR